MNRSDPLSDYCRSMMQSHRTIDLYTTVIGISLVTVFGVLGNAGTLLTLSARRLATATFSFYRAIALTDLIRCAFVGSYVLRVAIPFRRHYWGSWYEAHLMYFIINTLGILSTSLAVLLCVRLCIGILQSKRLKKTRTNPNTTWVSIFATFDIAVIVNFCLCFEYDVVQAVDMCSYDAPLVDPPEYTIVLSNFHFQHSKLLTVVHLLPVVGLLLLIGGASTTLVFCLLSVPKFNRNRPSKNALIVHCPSVRQSRPWRTQRQLCQLFLLLSLCYAFGLFSELLNTVVFSKVDEVNVTSAYEYKQRLAGHYKRENFVVVTNIFQNVGHAMSFYVYILCSEAFRAEFLTKIRQLFSTVRRRRAVGGFLVDKLSHSSDSKGQLRSATVWAELESEEAVTFAPELLPLHEAASPVPSSELARAISVSYTPSFNGADDRSSPLSDSNGDPRTNGWIRFEILSPVQLEPHRYNRFYTAKEPGPKP